MADTTGGTLLGHSWTTVWNAPPAVRAVFGLRALSVVAFLVFGIGLYTDAFTARHYSDDFYFIYGDSPHSVAYWFVHTNPYNVLAYRPLESVIYAALQKAFGAFNAAPLHAVNFGMHVTLAWLTLHVMLQLGFTRTQSLLGASYGLVSEVQVPAVAGLDSLSQMMGAALGSISIWLLWRSLWSRSLADGTWRQRPNMGLLGWSVTTFLLALFSKETSFGFFVSLSLLVGMWGFHARHYPSGAVRAAPYLIPYAACTLVALGVRGWVGGRGPTFGFGRYDLQFGFNNIAENVMSTVAGWAMPFSTAQVYLAIQGGHVWSVALMAAGTSLFIVFVTWGVWRSVHLQRCASLTLLTMAIAALLPVMFMHMSELYLYNSMPFISIIVGTGLGTFLERMRSKAPQRRVAGIVMMLAIAVLLSAHAFAVRQKVSLMKRQGERAAELLQKITAHAKHLPPGGQLVLLEQPSEEPKYSVYVMHGFDPIREGTRYVKEMSGRPDIQVDLYSTADPKALDRLPSEAVVLSLESSGDVLVVNRDPNFLAPPSRKPAQ